MAAENCGRGRAWAGLVAAAAGRTELCHKWFGNGTASAVPSEPLEMRALIPEVKLASPIR